MTLKISLSLYHKMIEHVQSTFPLEGCGLLAGRQTQATELYMIDNILQSPVAYEMDPKQQVKAMLDMDEKGNDMLAVYHSHPQGPSIPSETDITQAYYPESAYIIVSLQQREQPVVRAFTIVDERVNEISLIIV
jgi:proteasome lid subunit RPN8/RPN11